MKGIQNETSTKKLESYFEYNPFYAKYNLFAQGLFYTAVSIIGIV